MTALTGMGERPKRTIRIISISLTLVLFLTFSLAGLVHPANASPASVDVDANSLSTTDFTVAASFSQTSQFAVGVVLTGVSASDWIDDLFAFEFTMTFDPTVLTAQSVTGANTVEFGANAACPFGLRIPLQGFGLTIIDNLAGTVSVAFTHLDPDIRCDITSSAQLARVNFEIDKATAPGSTSVAVSGVLLVDENGVPIPTSTRESVWYDTDNTGTFTAGDVLVAGRSAQISPTPWEDDPKVKFIDTNGNGSWDSPPAQVAIEESVIYDTNSNSVYDLGDRVIGGPEDSPSFPLFGSPLVDDPKVKFVDVIADNVLTFGTSVAPRGGTVTETITNSPPTARFTFTPSNPVTPDPSGTTNVMFDASASTDSDGTITNYLWDFGDGLGEQDLGSTPTYGLVGVGSFEATVRVVDNLGASGAAKNNVGNVITDDQPSHTMHVVLIDSKPNGNFTVSDSNPDIGQTVSFDASSSYDPDPGGSITNYAWNFGDSGTASGVTATHAYSTFGAKTVTLTVTDDFGVTNSTIMMVVVNAPPTISFTEDKTTLFRSETATLTITASDPDGTITSIDVDWGDGTINNLPGSATSDTHSYTSLGTFTVTVTATDNSGAKAFAVATKTVVNRNPTVSFTEDKTSVVKNELITLTIASSDADGSVASIQVNWGDGTINNLPGSATSDTHAYTGGGTFTVTVTATDNEGGTASATATKTVANLPPTVSFTESATTALSQVTITLTLTSSDPDGTVASIRVNWGDGTIHNLAGTATSDTYAYPNPGSYVVIVTATDNDGATGSSSASKTITNRPPTVSFTEDTTAGFRQADITLFIVSSDPDGSIAATKVDWGDGTVHTFVGAVTNDRHAYTVLGTFTVRVNVTDTNGATATSSATKTIQNNPPSVTFTPSTTTPQAGQSVTLTIVSTDVDGTITSTQVNWGDGKTDTFTTTITTATHTYDKEGSYTITITVTDNNGVTKTSTTSITVGPSFPLPGGPYVWAGILVAVGIAVVYLVMRWRATRPKAQAPLTPKKP